MEVIIESGNDFKNKLITLLRIKELDNNLLKSVNVLNELKDKSIDNKINNLVKMFRISVECNAFDENEDKQRQCYKQFTCFWPKCKYSAKQISDLNRHISRHLHKRPFVCNQCNKDFNHLTSLNDHKRYIHSNVRQFVCRITNCQKKFKTNKDLNHHKRIHSSEKPFKCTEFDKRFKRSQHLKDHKLIHSGIKPFKCYVNNCDKSFVVSGDLKAHIHSKHKNEK